MTAPLTAARLSEIRARVEAATQALERLAERAKTDEEFRVLGREYTAGFDDGKAAVGEALETHIAASRQDVPDLLVEVDRLTAALDVAEKAIEGAQGALRTGSVPLGQSVMRHWDAKILAARNALADYDAAKEASHE